MQPGPRQFIALSYLSLIPDLLILEDHPSWALLLRQAQRIQTLWTAVVFWTHRNECSVPKCPMSEPCMPRELAGLCMIQNA